MGLGAPVKKPVVVVEEEPDVEGVERFRRLRCAKIGFLIPFSW